MGQDRALQLLQLRPRFEPELIDENATRLLVGGERIRLPARAVQGEHQLGPKPLPQRVFPDKPLQLRHELAVLAEPESTIDPADHGVHALLAQLLDLVPSERLEGEIRERRSTPERERFPVDRLGALRLSAPGQQAGSGGQIPEPPCIEPLLLDLQQVAARMGHDHVRAKHSA